MHTRFFCAIVCIIYNTLCLNDRIDDSDSICKDLLHLRQMVAPHLGNMIIDTLGLRCFLYRLHRNIALLFQPSKYTGYIDASIRENCPLLRFLISCANW